MFAHMTPFVLVIAFVLVCVCRLVLRNACVAAFSLLISDVPLVIELAQKA